jgi:hypothetical protein
MFSQSQLISKALQILVKSLRLFEHAVKGQKLILHSLDALIERMFRLKLDIAEVTENDIAWSSIPFSSSWQNEKHRLLSIRAHNMCVANSVAMFSGWEDSEFNLDLMRRKGKNTYFGITLNEGRIIGHLNADTAKQLADAWEVAETVLGITIDFAGRLDTAATLLVSDNHVDPPGGEAADVSIYGEKDALTVLISYAKQCFVIASSSGATAVDRSEFIKTGMSILLPIVSPKQSVLILPFRSFD